jgi:hypothetical protein
MIIELTYNDRAFDATIEVTEHQAQTLEQAGILFSLDIVSLKFSGESSELLDIIDVSVIEELEALALLSLINDTF